MFFFLADAFAQQPVLQLFNPETGELKTYKMGDKIGFLVKNDSTGTLQWEKISAIHADNIEIGGQQIMFNEIERIERYKLLQYLVSVVTLPVSIIGTFWFTAGVLFFTAGVFNFSEVFDPLGTADTFLVGGLIDMAIGLTLMLSPLVLKLIKNKRYMLSDGWQLKVKTFTP